MRAVECTDAKVKNPGPHGSRVVNGTAHRRRQRVERAAGQKLVFGCQSGRPFNAATAVITPRISASPRNRPIKG